jgi:hypothetical protein
LPGDLRFSIACNFARISSNVFAIIIYFLL